MKVKDEMATRCELALMGKVVEVRDNGEVVPMTQYLLGVLEPSMTLNPNFLEDTICKYSQNKVKYLVCNTLGDMILITYLLECDSHKIDEEHYPAPFAEDYGTGCPSAFCYTFNITADWCSEFGDCFFKKKSDGFYHRIS